MSMRHIINHDPIRWADDYLHYSKLFDAHASEIAAAQPGDKLSWHIVDQLKSMAAKAFDVQACILRANDIPHDDDVIDQMKDKEGAMPDRNIHNVNLAEAVDIIEREYRVVEEQRANNPSFDVLFSVMSDLQHAIDLISGADMEWFEALADDESEVLDVFDGMNVDAVNWTTAKQYDYIVLRELNMKAGTGPVYRLISEPAFADDDGNTMTALAELVHAPTTQWPMGTGLLTFDSRGWQAWRNFGGQS